VSQATELIAKQMAAGANIGKIWGTLIYNVKDTAYGAKGDGVTADTTAIAVAITAAAISGGIVMFPPGTYITANQTVPSNVTLWFANGAKLSINTGATVTINGAIDAGIYQIFAGLGTVVGNGQINGIPQWFGAIGNGTFDDGPAIQKCLNSFYRINFPSATYRSGVIITIPDFRYLFGNGSSFSTLNGITQLFYVPAAVGDIHFEKMSIVGTSPDFVAFQLEGARVWLNECTTFNVLTAIVSRNALHFISDCYLRGTNGVIFETSAEVRSLYDSVISVVGGNGVTVNGGAGLRINNCDIMGGNYNIMVNPTSGVVSSLNISDCFLDQGIYGCLALYPTGTGYVVRTKINNSWMTGSTLGGGILTTANVQGLQINCCDIYGNKADGIFVNSGGTIVNGCNIAGNLGTGVSVNAGATSFNITGNIIGPSGGYGGNQYPIYINAGASDVYVITGNILRGNTASLFDGGTGTNKVIANNVV
jgi:hypothetical protein